MSIIVSAGARERCADRKVVQDIWQSSRNTIGSTPDWRKGAIVRGSDVMLNRLSAEGPDPAHREEMMLFGRLVGSWQLDMVSFPPEQAARKFSAEWHFGWALGGRAVQDVLITRSPNGEVVGYGSTVRSFDPRRGLWWIVWQDPLAGEFSVLLAKPEGDRIVLHGEWTLGGATRAFRWTFSEIALDTFRWECHIQEDDGEWQLAEEIRAKRIPDIS
jgi:hypothetical protein